MTDSLDSTPGSDIDLGYKAADEPGTSDPALDRPVPEEIAVEAYAIYMAHGAHGRDLDDWLEAERRLHSKRQSQTA
jgi:hypothetical protein